MFASIPIEQFAIDCSHGIVNVLFTVQLPLVCNVLEDSGVSKKTINELMERVDVDLRALTSEEGSIEGSEVQRSISNALKFYSARLYNPLLDNLRHHCKLVKRIDDKDVLVADLVMYMFTLTHRMLIVAYEDTPSAEQIASACDAGRMLRKVLHALAQFLQQWGTLEPFLCHGFEGRWRDLKVETKHSTHGQWKGAKFGFETVMQYSIATWALMKLKVRLVGRSFHVPKTYGSALWDNFVTYVRQMTKDRNTAREAQ